MNNRQGRDLDQWITGVQADDLPALHAFVTGLGQDLDAVVAGLSLPYSSGAVEGHNNKIKMLKRQMFGRAKLRPPPQTGPPRRARPFMIAVSVTLRGPGTESDPEPGFNRRRHGPLIYFSMRWSMAEEASAYAAEVAASMDLNASTRRHGSSPTQCPVFPVGPRTIWHTSGAGQPLVGPVVRSR
jgi:hypothetical protein